MAKNSKHHPQRLRTFALDMQAVRGTQEQAGTPATLKSSDHEPTPVAAPPKPAKAIVRENIPKVEDKKPLTISVPQKASINSEHEPIITTPKAPTKMPAFHELQKSIATIQENIIADTATPEKRQQNKNVKKKNETSPRPNIGFDATVITDTKANRFQFFPSVFSSLKNWIKKITAKKPKKVPKYTVPETERRKGVIQRATSKTGAIFTADSETLKEQIRRRHIQEELEDEAETIWTPFTETGFSLLEAPDEPAPTIQNVRIEYKRQPQFVAPAPQRPETVPIPTYALNDEDLIAQESVDSPEDTLAEARWNASRDVVYDTPETISTPHAQLAAISNETRTIIPSARDVGEKVKIQKRGFLSAYDTNTLTVLLLSIIVGIVAAVFVARVVITKLHEKPSEAVSIEVPTEPLLTSAKLIGVPITASTLNKLPELVHEAVASSSVGLVEFAVVSAVGDEVSAPYLFDILHFRTTPNFRQSLTAARFASINHSQPAIILSFVDTDTVRGGLLNWEMNMPEDLRALYNLPAAVTPIFVDEKIAGVDARILRSKDEVILLYSIVGNNTAIIAKNSNDLAQMVELGRVR